MNGKYLESPANFVVELRDQSVDEPPRKVIIGFSFVDGEVVSMVDLTPSISIYTTEGEVSSPNIFQPFLEEFQVVGVWFWAT
jgi:hypothetical protein